MPQPPRDCGGGVRQSLGNREGPKRTLTREPGDLPCREPAVRDDGTKERHMTADVKTIAHPNPLQTPCCQCIRRLAGLMLCSHHYAQASVLHDAARCTAMAFPPLRRV
jgi:hypothetical protein